MSDYKTIFCPECEKEALNGRAVRDSGALCRRCWCPMVSICKLQEHGVLPTDETLAISGQEVQRILMDSMPTKEQIHEALVADDERREAERRILIRMLCEAIRNDDIDVVDHIFKQLGI